jgi:broad specificity phosphatase PhoE
MPTLLLLRHGEVPGITPPKFRGREELELTARGQKQAEHTAERVKADWPRVAAIYCSPRHRRVATAQAVGRRFGLTAQALPEFDDLDYGTWQGLTHDEARHKWPEQWALWSSAPECMAFPQGESLPLLAARVSGGLQKILPLLGGDDTVVVVAHDSTNRALLMQMLGMHLRFYRALAQDPCCINVIEAPGPSAQLRLLNATDHLRGL